MNKNIVIVTEKQSVVVRGIERKLKEQGFPVEISSDDSYEVKRHIDQCHLFVIYLSGDILDDRDGVSILDENCSVLRESGCAGILIGEKKDHEDLGQRAPAIRSMIWLDRPLDMDELLNKVMEAEESLERDDAAAGLPGDYGTDPMAMSMDADGLAAELEAQFAPAAAQEPKRILIVDDDPAFAKMVREWLRDLYKVDIVTNGLKAVTFLLKQNVDLVLLDYEMPDVDGPRVLEMLRSEPELAGVPVVFLTGVGDMDSVKRVMAFKPKGYILKSTSKQALIEYIEGVI